MTSDLLLGDDNLAGGGIISAGHGMVEKADGTDYLQQLEMICVRSKDTSYTENRRRTRQSCETYLSGLLDLIGCVGGITVDLLSLDSLRSTTNTHCLSVLEDDLERREVLEHVK